MAEQEQRQQHAEQRLGRDERRDDRDAAAVVRLEERDVREAEDDADAEEGQRAPERPAVDAAPEISVAAAATAGGTVVSVESQRTRLSRMAKRTVTMSA